MHPVISSPPGPPESVALLLGNRRLSVSVVSMNLSSVWGGLRCLFVLLSAFFLAFWGLIRIVFLFLWIS